MNYRSAPFVTEIKKVNKMAFTFQKKVESTPNSTSNNVEAPYTVVGYNKFHKKMLFGHIANGGGQVAIDRNYALKFIVDGSDYVQIELLRFGVKATATHQSFNRTKTVIEKVEVARKPKTQVGEDLIVSEEVTSEDLF